MKLHISGRMAAGLTLAFIMVFMFLPLYMGTVTYPFAIVQGTSMYPNLQNGDLVLFKHVEQQKITNGTVIIFIQSDTGVTLLDSFTKPIIIHRVVGSFVQADGTVYYNTKGDNNNINDASAVAVDHILGVPLITIPKIGLLFLFISSSQGLVAIVALITLFYLGGYEEKLKNQRILFDEIEHKAATGEGYSQLIPFVNKPRARAFNFCSSEGKYSGFAVNTISELANAIQKIDLESVEFYFYSEGFERWIRDVFQEDALAERIFNLHKEALLGEKLRKRLYAIINDWCEHQQGPDFFLDPGAK